MNKKPPGAELKKPTTVTLYPSTVRKAKLLKLNISKMIEAAIAALPEPEEEGQG